MDAARYEDETLVRGRACYTDDKRFSDLLYGAVVRSPYPAARISAIRSAAAQAMPGFVALFLADDLRAAGIGPIPFMSTIDDPDGGPPRCAALPVLAASEVRYVGQAVAFVIAESQALAENCAAQLEIDYEETAQVCDLSAAIEPAASRVDAGLTSNIAAVYQLGDLSACDAALAAAHHCVEVTITNNRVAPNPMEPRVCVGDYDRANDHLTLYCGNQAAHHTRSMLAHDIFGISEARIDVKNQRIGGGFGGKITAFAEDVMCLFAARELNRPVKWRATRSETFLADYHARDHLAHVSLGFDEAFKICALKIDDYANLGAYPTPFGIPIATTTGNRVVNGVYDIPCVSLTSRTVLTNTVPTGPYRGAGRPEVIHRLECALAKAAKSLQVDPLELRRRNMIGEVVQAHEVPSGLAYDSGGFAAVMAHAVELADWSGFAARKAQSRERGYLRGRGLACHIDSTSGLAPIEEVDVIARADGGIEFRSGTQEMGQGLSSTYRQLACEILGALSNDLDIVQGDTSLVRMGVGSYGSRSLYLGGAAVVAAAEALVAELLRLGGDLLEVIDESLSYHDGHVSTAAGDRSLSIAQIAAAQNEGRIHVSASAEAPFCFPNGCYICEVEIDQATGVVRVDHFSGVDDIGNAINERIVHGQIHGGLAQGIGQALTEQIIYESESGQLLSGSLLDYCLPRADDLPFFDAVLDQSFPARTNPLGAKGAGESGAVGGPPAVVLAVADALPDCPIEALSMPLTSEKIWRLIRGER